MKNAECYQILGIQPVVDPEANQKQIRKAFKKEAIAAHPDKLGGSNEAFIRLSDAYTQLTAHADKGINFDPAANSKNPSDATPSMPKFGTSYIVVSSRDARMYRGFRSNYSNLMWLMTGDSNYSAPTAKVVGHREGINAMFQAARDDMFKNYFERGGSFSGRPELIIEFDLPQEELETLLQETKDSSPALVKMEKGKTQLTTHQKLFAHMKNATLYLGRDELQSVCDAIGNYDNKAFDLLEELYKQAEDGFMDITRYDLIKLEPHLASEIKIIEKSNKIEAQRTERSFLADHVFRFFSRFSHSSTAESSNASLSLVPNSNSAD